MTEQNLRFRLGLFFLGILVLLAILILIFGGFPTLFVSTDEYTIVFTNAQGIAKGTPVRRSGVKIGEVQSLTLDNQTGKVKVRIFVRSNYKIRKADRPTVMMGLLGSDAAIEFLPPEPPNGKEQGFVAPGSTIEGTALTDPAMLMQKTSELMLPVQEALIEIKKVLQRFDKNLAPVVEDTLKEFREVAKQTQDFIPELRKTNNELLEISKATRATVPEFQLAARNWSKVGERMDVFLQSNEDKLVKTIDRMSETLKRISTAFSDENQKYLNDILKNTEVASRKFDSITRNTDDLIKETRGTVKSLTDSVKNVEEVFADIRKTTKPLGQRSETVMKNLEETTDALKFLVADARQIVLNVGRGEGTIQRLLVDPSLYNHLNESACSLNRLMPRVERIIRDVEIFADKIARHPESLGVGGAIRPGSGLKEPPSSVMPWRMPGHH